MEAAMIKYPTTPAGAMVVNSTSVISVSAVSMMAASFPYAIRRSQYKENGRAGGTCSPVRSRSHAYC